MPWCASSSSGSALEAMVVVDPPKNQGSLKENSGICEESIWGKDGNDAKVGSKARFLHPNTGFQDVSTSFNAAFWSRDVYKIIINYINVINWDTWMCVCVIHLWHFFLHLYSTVIHVCVCFNYLFIFNSSLNAPRTGIVGAQVTVGGVCRGVFGPSLSICTDWLRIPPGKQVAN